MAKTRHRVGIEGSSGSIFGSLTSLNGLSGWWASSATGVVEVGKDIELEFSDLAVIRFRYLQIIKNQIVELKCVSGPGPWQDSTLSIELQESENQVFVMLTHQNDNASEDDFLYFSTKWPIYLLSLRDLVEKGSGRPYPRDIKIHLGD